MSALSRRAFFGLAAAAPVAVVLPAAPARAFHSGGVVPRALVPTMIGVDAGGESVIEFLQWRTLDDAAAPIVFGKHRLAGSFIFEAEIARVMRDAIEISEAAAAATLTVQPVIPSSLDVSRQPPRIGAGPPRVDVHSTPGSGRAIGARRAATAGKSP